MFWANREPLRITDDEFAALHRAGTTDAEIIEALGRSLQLCCGYFFLDSQGGQESQIPISNDQNVPEQDVVWIFEFWSLEFV